MILPGALVIDTEAESMSFSDFAEVFDDGQSQVRIIVRNPVAHVHAGCVLDSAECEVGNEIPGVQAGIELRNINAELGAVDFVGKDRFVGQVVLADAEDKFIKDGRLHRVSRVRRGAPTRLAKVNRGKRDVDASIDRKAPGHLLPVLRFTDAKIGL